MEKEAEGKSSSDMVRFPMDEVVERLRHRQDPSTILEDLLRRNIVNPERANEAISLLVSLKKKVDEIRMGNQ